MYIIYGLVIAATFFFGMLFGSRMYYQMKVRKIVKGRFNKLVEERDDAKWRLSLTTLGTIEYKNTLEKYHLRQAQLDELKWVLFPEVNEKNNQ